MRGQGGFDAAILSPGGEDATDEKAQAEGGGSESEGQAEEGTEPTALRYPPAGIQGIGFD
ncbi:MAG: hypothetical protein KIT87_10035 [Anaerolineae bacterium]|nr:hypothetical protein [Anaerolineae bacterium]